MINMFSAEIVLRLCIAALLGGLLGLEREIHGRPAGLRTHLLVSLGAAAFMIMSPIIASFNQNLPGDPGRIAAQIVSGIGFLGAGAIVKEGVNIRGLTTAACLWIAAAIGMTTGAGSYFVAIPTSIIAIIALGFMPYVEMVIRKHSYRVLEVTTDLDVDVGAILSVVKEQHVHILRYDIDRDYEHNTLKTTMLIRLFHRNIADEYADNIVKAIELLNMSTKRIIWHPR